MNPSPSSGPDNKRKIVMVFIIVPVCDLLLG